MYTFRSWKCEVEIQRLEVGNTNSEVGSTHLEIRSPNSEVGSTHLEISRKYKFESGKYKFGTRK